MPEHLSSSAGLLVQDRKREDGFVCANLNTVLHIPAIHCPSFAWYSGVPHVRLRAAHEGLPELILYGYRNARWMPEQSAMQ